jgi:predicted HAD superfamily phosphohydrolase YqeG
MLHRVRRHVTHDLDGLERLLDGSPQKAVIVFDADNTLVRQGAPVDEFRPAVIAAVRRFESRTDVERVIVLTNGPDRDVPGMIHRGNKPWTTRRRLGLAGSGSTVWVVGDQVLTDGVLAWRLGATFVALAIDEEHEPSDQARMRRIGRWVAPLLFVS